MLALTKKIDYGLIALNYLANQSNERPVNTKEIAERFHIPVELLAKILQRLAKGGLIVSHQGPKGGYVLAKDPGMITVSEVIRAIEGPINVTDCLSGPDSLCVQLPRCTIKTPMRGVQVRVMQLLNSITLEEMREPNLSLKEEKVL